jgi:hypothetical protein
MYICISCLCAVRCCLWSVVSIKFKVTACPTIYKEREREEHIRCFLWWYGVGMQLPKPASNCSPNAVVSRSSQLMCCVWIFRTYIQHPRSLFLCACCVCEFATVSASSSLSYMEFCSHLANKLWHKWYFSCFSFHYDNYFLYKYFYENFTGIFSVKEKKANCSQYVYVMYDCNH